jgi:hypothetical protein
MVLHLPHNVPPPVWIHFFLYLSIYQVVGWYHSHPGFGCWLSGVDVNTQQAFEQLNKRAVAVVVDPIQSVKGKVPLISFFPGAFTASKFLDCLICVFFRL